MHLSAAYARSPSDPRCRLQADRCLWGGMNYLHLQGISGNPLADKELLYHSMLPVARLTEDPESGIV